MCRVGAGFLFSGMLDSLAAQLDGVVERVGDALYWQSPKGTVAIQGGGQIDGWVYYADDEGGPPGFWFPSDDGWVEAARLTLRADVFLGDSGYGFVKYRLDSGVHPGLVTALGTRPRDSRIDELFLRWQVTDGPGLSLQGGQFSPLFGGFLSRQDAWEMGLVSYPLLYENVTSVSDAAVAPTAAAFAARRHLTDGPRKRVWNNAIWAPSYLQGAMAFGAVGAWDYAVSFMNSAPASRGSAWNDATWNHPTWLVRAGYQPNPAWRVGVNASHGPYFRDDLAAALPTGTGIDDFNQFLLGLEARWAWRQWQVWAEAWRVRFDVPNVADDAVYYTGFVEARYALGPRWWLAARLNAEVYDDIRTEHGREAWDNDVGRVELGVGWRFARHAQLKAQYSYQEQDANFQNGRNFGVIEATLRF